MTRIFEALKKSQAHAGAFPFPPAEATPLRPAAVPRPLTPATPAAPAPRATALEPAIMPRIDARPALALPAEVMRQMNALRVGIESALEGGKTKVVMFLGPMGGEGVTTIAAQFASALAAEGRGSALLLDARAPRATVAPVRSARPARTGARAAQAPPTAPARRPEAGMPARNSAPLSVAALGDDPRQAGSRAPAAMRSTLEALASQFEWVIVDGPPVLEAPESVDLAPLVDGVVLVVRSGHTKRPVALRAAEMLRKSGVRVLGSVLNRRHLEIPDFIYRRT